MFRRKKRDQPAGRAPSLFTSAAAPSSGTHQPAAAPAVTRPTAFDSGWSDDLAHADALNTTPPSSPPGDPGQAPFAAPGDLPLTTFRTRAIPRPADLSLGSAPMFGQFTEPVAAPPASDEPPSLDHLWTDQDVADAQWSMPAAPPAPPAPPAPAAAAPPTALDTFWDDTAPELNVPLPAASDVASLAIFPTDVADPADSVASNLADELNAFAKDDGFDNRGGDLFSEVFGGHDSNTSDAAVDAPEAFADPGDTIDVDDYLARVLAEARGEVWSPAARDGFSPEPAPQVIPEIIPEAIPEPVAEVTPETVPEAIPEAIPEAMPDIAPAAQGVAGSLVVTAREEALLLPSRRVSDPAGDRDYPRRSPQVVVNAAHLEDASGTLDLSPSEAIALATRGRGALPRLSKPRRAAV